MLSAGDVAAVVAEATGRPVDPTAVGDDEGSHGRTQVVRVGPHVWKLFLQIGTRKCDREVAALTHLRGCGLAVPDVVATGALGDGRRWLLQTAMPGTQPFTYDDLEGPQARPLHEELGRLAARLHAVPAPPAFGAWTVDPHRSYAAMARLRTAELLAQAHQAELAPAALIARLADDQHRRVDCLDEVRTPVLVHRDMSFRNVFARQVGGRWSVTALFDFEAAGGGDPLEELRWLTLRGSGNPLLAGFASGYRELRSLPGDTTARLTYHALDVALDVFTYAGARSPWLLEHALSTANAVLDGEDIVLDT